MKTINGRHWQGGQAYRDIFGGGDAPDYSGVAEASKESAAVAERLGNRQMDIAEKNFNRTMAIAEPIAQEQLGQSRENRNQARETYGYIKSMSRPVTSALALDALGLTPEQQAEYMRLQAADETSNAAALKDAEAKIRAERIAFDKEQAAAKPTAASPAPTQSGDGIDRMALLRDFSQHPANGGLADEADLDVLRYGNADQIKALFDSRPLSPLYKQDVDLAKYGIGAKATTPEGTVVAGGTAPVFRGSDVNDLYTANTSASDAYLQTARAAAANRQKAEDQSILDEDSRLRQQMLDTGAGFERANATQRALITGGDQGIYDKRKDDIEWQVGNAMADARSGQATATNQAARQMARLGLSPAAMAARMGSAGNVANAAQITAAANATRQSGIDRGRQLEGADYDMRQGENARSMNLLATNKAAKLDTVRTGQGLDSFRRAKQLDVVGALNGSNSSQGAYSLALNAGNSAVNNQQAPVGAYQSGMAAGAGTVLQGRQMLQNGLGSVLSSQTQSGGGEGMGGLGALLGGGAKLWSAFNTGGASLAV